MTAATAAASVASEWTLLPQSDEYQVVFDTDVRSEVVNKRFELHLREMDRVLREEAAKVHGQAARTSPLSVCDIYDVVAKDTMKQVQGWAREQSNITAEVATSDMEFQIKFRRFVASYLSTQLYGVDLERGTQVLGACAERERPGRGSRVLEPTEYSRIFSMLRTFPVAVEHPDEWQQTTDVMTLRRNFEDTAFGVVRRIACTPYACIVIDDELVPTRSNGVESKILSNRKAGGEGIKNDAVADSLLRIFLGVRHKQRMGYSQANTVPLLLDKVCEARRGALRDGIVTADRGYSAWWLWETLVARRMSFIMICKDRKDFPLTKDTSPLPGDLNPVPDVEVQKLLQEEEREVAERREQRLGDDDDEAEVDDITYRGHSDTDIDVATHGQGSDDDTHEAPTATGDCADADEGRVDWSVSCHPLLGRELFTAKRTVTTGSPSVSGSLTAVVYRDYETAQKESKLLRFVASSASSGALPSVDAVPVELQAKLGNTICMERMTIRRGGKPARNVLFYPCPSRLKGEVLRGAESEMLTRVTPLTCWQRSAEWFMLRMFTVTGTASKRLVSGDEDARTLIYQSNTRNSAHVLEAAVTDNESAARVLVSAWVFRRGVRTPAMKTGTINEANVIEALRRQTWCVRIFDVGLLAMKGHEHYAVSPDAIICLKPPCSNQEVYVSCEIKTWSAPERVEEARGIQRAFGTYFSCAAGDDTWWNVVPTEYRGQVLHQAMVTQSCHTLFCVSDNCSLLYAALVEVSHEQRETYRRALDQWKTLLTWAQASLNESGPPPTIPSAFRPQHQKVLSSHVRLWRAVAKRVKHQGVLPPLHIFKSYAQVIYNMVKGGVDGSTQYVENISDSCMHRPNVDQMLVTRTLKQHAVNAFLLHRVHTFVQEHRGCTTISLSSFRKWTAKQAKLRSTIAGLGVALLASAEFTTDDAAKDQGSNPATSNTGVAPEITALDFQWLRDQMPCHVNKIYEFLNSAPAVRVRLDRTNFHAPEALPPKKNGKHTSQRRCFVCNTVTSTQCTTCGLAMHILPIADRRVSCFIQFHNTKRLPRPTYVRKRKRAATGSGDAAGE